MTESMILATPCTVCGQPTRRADGICHRHDASREEQTLVTPDGDRLISSAQRFTPPSAAIGGASADHYAKVTKEGVKRGATVTLLLIGKHQVKVARTSVRAPMTDEGLRELAKVQRDYWRERGGYVAKVNALHQTTASAAEIADLNEAVAFVAQLLSATVGEPKVWTPGSAQQNVRTHRAESERARLSAQTAAVNRKVTDEAERIDTLESKVDALADAVGSLVAALKGAQ